MNGSCACGAVAYTTPTTKPLMLFHCHCIDCRKQSSSAFGTSAIFPYFSVADNPSGGHSAVTFAKLVAAESSMLTSSKTALPKSLPSKVDYWRGLIGVEPCTYIAGALSRRFLRAQ
ncbi:hypothetical protein SNOG_02931 [Parastagonospora nodorum SN15]|uniref:CENP-V/GFA domain-containing protein n=1 Tax=Phaeosphaeria nodorum (strain SN15 / ATCC MYA-4574 / FGSC 10173) TaxID=321614 RepID=Q0UZ83_PHANO|nr:hypothetical protein SNOG_02931 [Parastagonospora nodorum SN15]EAT89662.1 hypothetical protein SNOG_02931 [Parastagonospora nodorum SN15]